MNEKEIIKNLKKLRKVRPEKDWVFSNKKELLGESLPYFPIMNVLRNISGNFFLVHKFASVFILIFASFAGMAVYAQNSLPGDAFYSVKKATEKAQFAFKTGDEVTLSFEVAQRRLDDLDRAVRTNSSKNLAPSINEFQATVSEAAKSIKVAEVKDIKAVSKNVEKIEERQEKIRSLGIEIGENKEFNDLKQGIACKRASELIDFTKTRTLTKEQEELFKEAEELFVEEKCTEAEEKILFEVEKPLEFEDIKEDILEEEEENEMETEENEIEIETEKDETEE